MESTARHFVRNAIVEALEGADGLQDIPVAVRREPKGSEYIWIYKTRAKREFKLIGPQPPPCEEKVSVYLRVVAIKGDDQVAEERAEEIGEAVEATLRALQLDRPVLEPLLVEEVDSEALDFDQKVGHHVLMTATTKARI